MIIMRTKKINIKESNCKKIIVPFKSYNNEETTDYQAFSPKNKYATAGYHSKDKPDISSIFSGNLKKAISEHLAQSVKSDSIDVYITGPFINKGKSHFVVVYGDFGQAYMLKANFLQFYLNTLLRKRDKVMKSDVDVNHSKTYCEIGIRLEEYGEENEWKRRESKDGRKSPVTRVSFVYSCDTRDLEKAKQVLKEAIDFFFLVVKKRKDNPIGPLHLEFLKERTSGLYKYLMKDGHDEEVVAERITNVIDQHFSGGYTLHWNDSLNHWLVNYDIIRILKCHVGYSSWIDVSDHERQLCFMNYKVNDELPRWNCDQLRY